MNWYNSTKFANANNIEAALGIPKEVAKIINKKVGDKWGFTVARWFLNYSGVTSLKEDYEFPHSDYAKEYNLLVMESIGVMNKIVNLPIETRVKIARQNENFLYYYFRKYDDLWSDLNFKQFSETQLEDALDDELLPFALEEAKKKFEETFDRFIATDFVRDLVANQSFNKQYCKNLNYGEAMKEYLEEVKVRNMPVVLQLGNFRWVNAGSGLSEYVREKMKNCGKSSWGALRHVDPSSTEMLLLLDGHNNPHIIATWVPNYVDFESPDDPEQKFLGSIEGVGSSIPKEKYYPFIKALFEHLKPDIASIKGNMQSGPDGVVLDNRNLMNELGIDGKGPYGISKYPGPAVAN